MIDKKNILKKLLDNKIIKIGGKKRYTPGYFKIDDKLNILSYNKHINFTNNFEIRNDMTIDKLLNHIIQMQKENFTIEFFDIVLF